MRPVPKSFEAEAPGQEPIHNQRADFSSHQSRVFCSRTSATRCHVRIAEPELRTGPGSDWSSLQVRLLCAPQTSYPNIVYQQLWNKQDPSLAEVAPGGHHLQRMWSVPES